MITAREEIWLIVKLSSYLAKMSLFPTPKDLTKKELKEFVGHKDEVSIFNFRYTGIFFHAGSGEPAVCLAHY